MNENDLLIICQTRINVTVVVLYINSKCWDFFLSVHQLLIPKFVRDLI